MVKNMSENKNKNSVVVVGKKSRLSESVLKVSQGSGIRVSAGREKVYGTFSRAVVPEYLKWRRVGVRKPSNYEEHVEFLTKILDEERERLRKMPSDEAVVEAKNGLVKVGIIDKNGVLTTPYARKK